MIISSHPSLTGMSSGTGLSGSTAWHNSVRARMYLASLSDQDEGADPNLRELRFLKNNYGPTGEPILLKWQNGMFVRQGTPNMFDRVAAEANAEQVYLDCLEAVHASGARSARTKASSMLAVFEKMRNQRRWVSVQRIEASPGTALRRPKDRGSEVRATKQNAGSYYSNGGDAVRLPTVPTTSFTPSNGVPTTLPTRVPTAFQRLPTDYLPTPL